MENNKQRREDSMRDLRKALKNRERKEKAQPFGVAAAALGVVALVGGGIWFLTTHDSTSDNSETSTTAAASSTQTPNFTPLAHERTHPLPETVSCTYESDGDPSRPVSAPNGENVPARGTVTVSLDTNKGKIEMKLNREVSPCAVNAIEHLAKEHFYDDTVCHRMVVDGLHILQCGDPTATGTGGPGFKFANEFPTDEADASAKETPVNYERGTIALANSGEGNQGSQFFLNFGDSPLPPKYTYFGQIDDEGLHTLDAIAEKGVQKDNPEKPAEEIRISRATVE